MNLDQEEEYLSTLYSNILIKCEKIYNIHQFMSFSKFINLDLEKKRKEVVKIVEFLHKLYQEKTRKKEIIQEISSIYIEKIQNIIDSLPTESEYLHDYKSRLNGIIFSTNKDIEGEYKKNFNNTPLTEFQNTLNQLKLAEASDTAAEAAEAYPIQIIKTLRDLDIEDEKIRNLFNTINNI